ncbi:unnamed protein product, partial [Mesorhabditis spiculigera]
MATKPAPALQSSFKDRAQFQLGSLSHVLNQRCSLYKDLSEFPETSSDPALRREANAVDHAQWLDVGEEAVEEEEDEDEDEDEESDEEGDDSDDEDDEEEEDAADEEGDDEEDDDDSDKLIFNVVEGGGIELSLGFPRTNQQNFTPLRFQVCNKGDVELSNIEVCPPTGMNTTGVTKIASLAAGAMTTLSLGVDFGDSGKKTEWSLTRDEGDARKFDLEIPIGEQVQPIKIPEAEVSLKGAWNDHHIYSVANLWKSGDKTFTGQTRSRKDIMVVTFEEGSVEDLVQTVYNWQLIQCLYMWVRVIGKSHDVEGADALNELHYPLTQVVVATLNASAQQVEEAGWRQAAADTLFKILLQAAHILSSSPAFPDATLIASHQIRSFCKNCRSPDISRLFKALNDKIREHSIWVLEKMSTRGIDLAEPLTLLRARQALADPASPIVIYHNQFARIWKMRAAALQRNDTLAAKKATAKTAPKEESEEPEDVKPTITSKQKKKQQNGHDEAEPIVVKGKKVKKAKKKKLNPSAAKGDSIDTVLDLRNMDWSD